MNAYIVSVAILMAAFFLSGVIYFSANQIAGAIKEIKIEAPPLPQQPPAPSEPAEPEEPEVSLIYGLDYKGAPSTGNPNGNIVMIVYSDFECPYCSSAVPTVKKLLSEYPNINLVYQNFPLPFHPNAKKAAEASLCAHDQGKFWELHDKMFQNQKNLSVASLKAYAEGIGMDMEKFNACLDGGSKEKEVSLQMQGGITAGVGATPTFIVYSKSKSSPSAISKIGKTVERIQSFGAYAMAVEVYGAGNGILFSGALPYSVFKEVVESLN